MYADYTYYQGTYYGSLLTEEQWPAAAREADAWVDRLTFGRLRKGAPVDDAVRMACCAAAEACFRWQQADAERPLGLASFNNDGYSESYITGADHISQRQSDILAAVGLYLPQSHPLRYAGGDCCARL